MFGVFACGSPAQARAGFRSSDAKNNTFGFDAAPAVSATANRPGRERNQRVIRVSGKGRMGTWIG